MTVTCSSRAYELHPTYHNTTSDAPLQHTCLPSCTCLSSNLVLPGNTAALRPGDKMEGVSIDVVDIDPSDVLAENFGSTNGTNLDLNLDIGSQFL